MRKFGNYNPIAVFIYYIAVVGIAMFCRNPLLFLLSLTGSLLFCIISGGMGGKLSAVFLLLLFAVMALINPLFNHNGKTVLFILNNNPVTLEAVLYGVSSSVMVISVICWFRSFSKIMTGDKLQYVFGALSPKTALLLSMTLRYVPLFGKQIKKVNNAQKALGLYKDDNVIDKIKSSIRVFSIMLTWALENGIITADSMEARGYGIGKRSFYSLYRFRKSDGIFLSAVLALTVIVVCAAVSGAIDFMFYPSVSPLKVTPLSIAAYISYALAVFLPSLIDIPERLKWKYLQSKI